MAIELNELSLAVTDIFDSLLLISKNFIKFALIMKFEEIKEILKTKTVGIAGWGGLGSNCAISLARVGIGKLVIADFDIVTKANLNRQYYFTNQIGQIKSFALKDNINAVNPDCKVINHKIKLDSKNIPEIYKDCNVIVEAFDLAEMKKMILETVLAFMPDKYLVSGLGMAGWGESNTIKTTNYDKLTICGDFMSEVSDDNPPLAPRVCIVSNMQANRVLEIFLKK